ncbi:hypothetical protein [Hymenobacter sp.]|jgi:hypothetical protein|uniref:hypothetical protein n=1 Tax=Hymenobacter sp. TaxID=1898978 RepID=UPI002ED7CF91
MNLLPADDQHFIPLISGYGFKVTFGNEANSLFLRRALQALIQSDTAIEQVTFLPNELSRLTKDSPASMTWPARMRPATSSSWRCS